MQSELEVVIVTYDSVEDGRKRVEEGQERGHRQESERCIRKRGDKVSERRHLDFRLCFINEWVSKDCAGCRLLSGLSSAVGVSVYHTPEHTPIYPPQPEKDQG